MNVRMLFSKLALKSLCQHLHTLSSLGIHNYFILNIFLPFFFQVKTPITSAAEADGVSLSNYYSLRIAEIHL